MSKLRYKITCFKHIKVAGRKRRVRVEVTRKQKAEWIALARALDLGSLEAALRKVDKEEAAKKNKKR